MFNYIFPIFCFGLVITGIVFLGLQQAADVARKLTALEDPPESTAPVANERNGVPLGARRRETRPEP